MPAVPPSTNSPPSSIKKKIAQTLAASIAAGIMSGGSALLDNIENALKTSMKNSETNTPGLIESSGQKENGDLIKTLKAIDNDKPPVTPTDNKDSLQNKNVVEEKKDKSSNVTTKETEVNKKLDTTFSKDKTKVDRHEENKHGKNDGNAYSSITETFPETHVSPILSAHHNEPLISVPNDPVSHVPEEMNSGHTSHIYKYLGQNDLTGFHSPSESDSLLNDVTSLRHHFNGDVHETSHNHQVLVPSSSTAQNLNLLRHLSDTGAGVGTLIGHGYDVDLHPAHEVLKNLMTSADITSHDTDHMRMLSYVSKKSDGHLKPHDITKVMDPHDSVFMGNTPDVEQASGRSLIRQMDDALKHGVTNNQVSSANMYLDNIFKKLSPVSKRTFYKSKIYENFLKGGAFKKKSNILKSVNNRVYNAKYRNNIPSINGKKNVVGRVKLSRKLHHHHIRTNHLLDKKVKKSKPIFSFKNISKIDNKIFSGTLRRRRNNDSLVGKSFDVEDDLRDSGDIAKIDDDDNLEDEDEYDETTISRQNSVKRKLSSEYVGVTRSILHRAPFYENKLTPFPEAFIERKPYERNSEHHVKTTKESNKYKINNSKQKSKTSFSKAKQFSNSAKADRRMLHDLNVDDIGHLSSHDTNMKDRYIIKTNNFDASNDGDNDESFDGYDGGNKEEDTRFNKGEDTRATPYDFIDSPKKPKVRGIVRVDTPQVRSKGILNTHAHGGYSRNDTTVRIGGASVKFLENINSQLENTTSKRNINKNNRNSNVKPNDNVSSKYGAMKKGNLSLADENDFEPISGNETMQDNDTELVVNYRYHIVDHENLSDFADLSDIDNVPIESESGSGSGSSDVLSDNDANLMDLQNKSSGSNVQSSKNKSMNSSINKTNHQIKPNNFSDFKNKSSPLNFKFKNFTAPNKSKSLNFSINSKFIPVHKNGTRSINSDFKKLLNNSQLKNNSNLQNTSKIFNQSRNSLKYMEKQNFKNYLNSSKTDYYLQKLKVQLSELKMKKRETDFSDEIRLRRSLNENMINTLLPSNDVKSLHKSRDYIPHYIKPKSTKRNDIHIEIIDNKIEGVPRYRRKYITDQHINKQKPPYDAHVANNISVSETASLSDSSEDYDPVRVKDNFIPLNYQLVQAEEAKKRARVSQSEKTQIATAALKAVMPAIIQGLIQKALKKKIENMPQAPITESATTSNILPIPNYPGLPVMPKLPPALPPAAPITSPEGDIPLAPSPHISDVNIRHLAGYGQPGFVLPPEYQATIAPNTPQAVFAQDTTPHIIATEPHQSSIGVELLKALLLKKLHGGDIDKASLLAALLKSRGQDPSPLMHVIAATSQQHAGPVSALAQLQPVVAHVLPTEPAKLAVLSSALHPSGDQVEAPAVVSEQPQLLPTPPPYDLVNSLFPTPVVTVDPYASVRSETVDPEGSIRSEAVKSQEDIMNDKVFKETEKIDENALKEVDESLKKEAGFESLKKETGFDSLNKGTGFDKKNNDGTFETEIEKTENNKNDEMKKEISNFPKFNEEKISSNKNEIEENSNIHEIEENSNIHEKQLEHFIKLMSTKNADNAKEIIKNKKTKTKKKKKKNKHGIKKTLKTPKSVMYKPLHIPAHLTPKSSGVKITNLTSNETPHKPAKTLHLTPKYMEDDDEDDELSGEDSIDQNSDLSNLKPEKGVAKKAEKGVIIVPFSARAKYLNDDKNSVVKKKEYGGSFLRINK